MRIVLAFLLSLPLYIYIDFGWLFVSIIGLQLLAGLNVELFEK